MRSGFLSWLVYSGHFHKVTLLPKGPSLSILAYIFKDLLTLLFTIIRTKILKVSINMCWKLSSFWFIFSRIKVSFYFLTDLDRNAQAIMDVSRGTHFLWKTVTQWNYSPYSVTTLNVNIEKCQLCCSGISAVPALKAILQT